MQKQSKKDKYELTAAMIGAPGDDFSKPELETSIRKESNMRAGYIAGFQSAADDYVNGKATTQVFEKLREARDITDFYALGFELGYMRKLAEILVG
jgi:glutathione peroxidase-family protein